jgi:type I restriction enzyme S subunit
MIPLHDSRAFQIISGLWKGSRGPFVRTRVLRSTNFRGDGLLDYGDVAELDVDESQFSERRLEPKDIIIERSGGGPKQPVGRVGLFEPPDDANYCTSNFTSVIRVVDKQAFDPTFVSLFLHDLYLSGNTEQLQRATTGIRNLAWSDYLDFPVPRLPLVEQRSIVLALNIAQRSYLLEAEMVTNAEQLKRTAMRELFTRGLHGEETKESETGPVPEKWSEVKLGDLLRIRHGYAFEGAFFRPTGEYTLLTPGHFAEDGGFRHQGDKTKCFTGTIPLGFVLQEGDLVVAMTEQKSGLLGSAAFIPRGKYLHNQRLGLVADLDANRLSKRYLFHFLNYASVRAIISRNASGFKVRHTSPDKIRSITIALPSLSEQDEIANIFDAIDQKINLHKRKGIILDDLFKALVHKLMTGEIRVSDLDLSALQTPTADGASS